LIAECRVELALPQDAGEIARMSRAYIEQGLPWSWTPARVARSIANRATNVAVVREEGLLIGFAIMYYADTLAHLQLMAIHAKRRRSGIGSALHLWLEEVARVAGISEARVEARSDNPAARAFYGRHGYEELRVVNGMYHGICQGVRLRKRLNLD
jgi:ribosomal-protein-alanine N-acetyltransferase